MCTDSHIYSPEQLRRIYCALNEGLKNKTVTTYRVLIDGKEVIPHTEDKTLFSLFDKMLDDSSYKIDFFLYCGEKCIQHDTLLLQA